MTITTKDGPTDFTLVELYGWCFYVKGDLSSYGNACGYVEFHHLNEIKELAGIPAGLESEDPCGYVYGGQDYQQDILDATEKLADKYGYLFDTNGHIITK